MSQKLLKISVLIGLLSACGPLNNKTQSSSLSVGETVYVMPSIPQTIPDNLPEKALLIKFVAQIPKTLPDDGVVKIIAASHSPESGMEFVWSERSKVMQNSNCPERLMSRVELDNEVLICKGIKGISAIRNVEIELQSGKKLSASALIFEEEDADVITAQALLY